MELIEDEDKEQGALPEPEPRRRSVRAEEDSGDDYERPRWLMPLVIAIIIAAIVVGLVFLARWIYHEVNHNNAPAASSSTNKQPAASPNSRTGGRKSGGASASQNSSSAGGRSGSASNKQITNTGPGNVVGIFVGASLAAAGLHYVVSLRRFNKGHRT